MFCRNKIFKFLTRETTLTVEKANCSHYSDKWYKKTSAIKGSSQALV